MKKISFKFLFISLLILLIFSCGIKKIPPDKQSYIGKWQGKDTILIITENGRASFEKNTDNFNKSISGPIQKFEENNFEIGMLFIKMKIDVDKPPYKEDNIWKMNANGIELIKVNSNENRKIPNVEDLKKIVNRAFELFNESLNKKDFVIFYNGISKFWQSQTKPEKLYEAFKVFIDNDINLKNQIKKEIVFSNEPYVNENNWLILEGYYTSKPKVFFKLSFVYEYPNWKLVGFNCEIK